ncbi:hypothetical protein BRC65_09825 [Halobacteriales archaeon QH_2_65_14]|nr:MAG: hypothetical protein BRC65_09825 [Halobacteriales archaeon QH_2_65_14]
MSGHAAAGLILLVFGVPLMLWPYELARIDEEWDALSLKRPWWEVEPADWKVDLTRYVGRVLTALGAVLLFFGVL